MLAPQKGSYLLDIFAAEYPNYDTCQKKEPTKYINVCRFQINCNGVDKVNQIQKSTELNSSSVTNFNSGQRAPARMRARGVGSD